jgi:hypothetical protein
MSLSGVLGRGSYRSVVAGTSSVRKIAPTYHPCAFELNQLNAAHNEVVKNFYVRDRIFDNKIEALKFVNGMYKFDPVRRQSFHMNDVMESVRRRSFWMTRIQQQRAINAKLVKDADEQGKPHPAEALRTADADAYFRPKSYKGAVNWPNFWQHDSSAHVVPKARWQRHPELKGITRVVSAATPQANDY